MTQARGQLTDRDQSTIKKEQDFHGVGVLFGKREDYDHTPLIGSVRKTLRLSSSKDYCGGRASTLTEGLILETWYGLLPHLPSRVLITGSVQHKLSEHRLEKVFQSAPSL